MNELDRYGLIFIIGFLFAVFALATSGCASRRFIRMEADEITLQVNASTVVSGIPAIEAKGFRLWKATGDKTLEIPDAFFIRPAPAETAVEIPVSTQPDHEALLNAMEDGEMTLWKPYGSIGDQEVLVKPYAWRPYGTVK